MGTRCSLIAKPMPPAYDTISKTTRDAVVEDIWRMLKRRKRISAYMIELSFEALRINGVLRYIGPSRISYSLASAIVLGTIEGYVPEHGQCVADYDPIQHRIRWLPGWPLPSPVRKIADFYFKNSKTESNDLFLGQLIATHSSLPITSTIPELWSTSLAEEIANHRHSKTFYSIIENAAGGYKVTFQ